MRNWRTRIFVQQVHGAAYAGAERSIASLLEAGLVAKLDWLARFGIDVAFHGTLAEEDNISRFPTRIEAAASRLDCDDSQILFLASDHSAATSTIHPTTTPPGAVREPFSRSSRRSAGISGSSIHRSSIRTARP